MSNFSQIGPKLVHPEHDTEEKIFLETKQTVFEEIPDEIDREKPKKMFLTNYLGNVKLSMSSPLSATHNSGNKSPITKTKEKRKMTKMMDLLPIFKKTKNLVSRVKNAFYYKNYKNMTEAQKNILNDITVFPALRQNEVFQYFFYKKQSIIKNRVLGSSSNFSSLSPTNPANSITNIFGQCCEILKL